LAWILPFSPALPFLQAQAEPELRARLGIPQDAFVIGKIARLFLLKGHEDLLQAFKIVQPDWPSARILFVGGGPLRAQLEARARELDLQDKVVFAGLVPPNEIPRYVATVDAFPMTVTGKVRKVEMRERAVTIIAEHT